MSPEQSRRQFLRAGLALGAVGLGAAPAGADGTAGSGDRRNAGGARNDTAGGSDAWPSFRHDAANTGYSSSLSAPGGPTVSDWSFAAGDAVISSPAVVDGTAYVGCNDGTLYALDVEWGSTEWTADLGGKVLCSPTVTEGSVFVGSDAGDVVSLDTSDGSREWSASLGNRIRASPVVTGGTVYAADNAGTVRALSASDGTGAWSRTLDGIAINGPAFADGTLLVGAVRSAYSKLHALSPSDGSDQWVYESRYFVTSSPAVSGSSVYVGSTEDDGDKLVSLSLSDGSVNWEFDAGQLVVSSPAVADGDVFFGSDSGKVYSVDAGDGTKNWEYETGGPVRSSPAVADGVVVVGSTGGTLYGLDPTDGTELWSVATDSIRSSPALANYGGYVGTDGGRVVRVTPEPLTWADASDWDDATRENGVVHYGTDDRDADTLSLGYGTDDGSLVAYWPLDDDGGPVVDRSGNGNEASVEGGGVELGSLGLLGTHGAYFKGDPVDADGDGTDDFEPGYLDVGQDLSSELGGSAFTWAAWVKIPGDSSEPVAGDEDALLAANRGPDADSPYSRNVALYVRGNDTTSNDGHLAAHDGTFHSADSPTVVTDNEWHHVALTWDTTDTAGTYDGTLYVDGGQELTFSSSRSIHGPESSSGADVFSIGQAYSGTTTDDSGDTVPQPADFFEGHVEDVRVYDTALSSSAVDSLTTIGNGVHVTVPKEFSATAPVDDLQLRDVTAVVDGSRNVLVTVQSDPAGDGSWTGVSDPITLDGSGGPYDVTGLSSESKAFRLKLTVSTGDIEKNALFGGANLVAR